MHGYKEKGTTTTPFDMVMLNDLDRFHLVIDVVDRLPALAGKADHLRQEMTDSRLRARAYGREYGEDPPEIAAVAHRVVHGGPRFRDPILIDANVRGQIFELVSLAPLHNAPALEAIEAAVDALPEVPHVAVFDTAFHRTIPDEAAVY